MKIKSKFSNKKIYKFFLLLFFLLLFASIGTYLIFFSKAATSLTADFNSDNKVDIFDLSILSSNWGKTGATKAMGDANGDGSVNIFDLSALANEWGKTTDGQPANSINVKDYGVVGDGATDDTTKLTTAINTAVSQSKIAYIPNGTYLLKSRLTIPDNATVQGQDMINTWLKGAVTAGTDQNLSKFKVGDFGATFKFGINSNNTNLTDIHFRGGGKASSDSPVIYIGAHSSTNNYIHHINFTNCEVERNLGIQTGNYSNWSINYNNISIYAQATTGATRVTDIKFEGCKIGVSNGQGGHDTGSPRMNVEIHQHDAFYENPSVVQTQGFERIDWINNIFEAADITNLDYAGAHNTSTGFCLSGWSIVRGNLFKGSGYVGGVAWDSDVTLEPACNMLVENNTFWTSYGYSGISIESKPDRFGFSQNNIFRNNIIDHTVQNGIIHDPLTIAFSISGINNEFSGNTIKLEKTNNFLDIHLGNGNKVLNNNITINTNVSPIIHRFGWKDNGVVTAISTGNTISNNTYIMSNVSYDIYNYAGSTGNTVTNNIFRATALPRFHDEAGDLINSGNTLNP
jgi:hypothetical protein